MKVQAQPPQQSDADGLRPVERQLMDAVTRLREEEFPARPRRAMRALRLHPFCPAHSAGTVLS